MFGEAAAIVGKGPNPHRQPLQTSAEHEPGAGKQGEIFNVGPLERPVPNAQSEHRNAGPLPGLDSQNQRRNM